MSKKKAKYNKPKQSSLSQTQNPDRELSENEPRSFSGSPVEATGTEKASGKGFLKKSVFFPRSGLFLALRIFLALAIPYALLMLSGLVFDRWLHWYFMTTWIFIFLCIFYLLAIVFIVLCVKNFAGRKK